ncbi:Nudix family hydrolase [Wenzhouxiangella sp. AB-CW3]|uniref:Nudix family hydrolase n=1 Tax=Wenzhouxiangella sp. AB-CW3 TaxID=2771012 RepID=UPI00168A4801|nr:Nudix family hydrolase [Wenzhouxiangella sp. AB-CW3]QOC23206.1 Nudix family hydrolase [Wenzhouxiangella sp. AB-CW3]
MSQQAPPDSRSADRRQPLLRVAAAVIRDQRGRILLGQRPAGKHLAGTWEFPGGKCDPNETAQDALARELLEELGVACSDMSPLLALTHHYPERAVHLMLYQVGQVTGTAYGREGQALRWVSAEELDQIDMPAADRPIAKALNLSPRYAITPDPADAGGRSALLDWVRGALDAGIELLQLRAHSLSSSELLDLGYAVDRMVRARGGRWLINADPELARQSGADGVHLSSPHLRALNSRPLPDDRLVIASCHNDEELAHAGGIDADLVCLSPVTTTPSHPEAVGLGWDGFKTLCRRSPLPVFALGGIGPADLATARVCGAFGVAGISAFGPR